MDQQEMDTRLLNGWIKEQEELDSQQKQQMLEWLLSFQGKLEELYEYYRTLPEDGDADHTEQGIKLPSGKWKQFLPQIIGILQPILPLGSVVDLKKDRLEEQLPAAGKMEQVRIVITHRFLSYTRYGYFTYAGMVYPMGTLRGNEMIHFNPMMIASVVHRGYEDLQESAWVLHRKQDQILNKKRHSYEFASQEESRELVRYMEGRNGRED